MKIAGCHGGQIASRISCRGLRKVHPPAHPPTSQPEKGKITGGLPDRSFGSIPAKDLLASQCGWNWSPLGGRMGRVKEFCGTRERERERGVAFPAPGSGGSSRQQFAPFALGPGSETNCVRQRGVCCSLSEGPVPGFHQQ